MQDGVTSAVIVLRSCMLQRTAAFSREMHRISGSVFITIRSPEFRSFTSSGLEVGCNNCLPPAFARFPLPFATCGLVERHRALAPTTETFRTRIRIVYEPRQSAFTWSGLNLCRNIIIMSQHGTWSRSIVCRVLNAQRVTEAPLLKSF